MSSNHRDGPDYNEPSFDHPCKQTCSGWRQGFDRGFYEARGLEKKRADGYLLEAERHFDTIQALQKELQAARAENEAMMSTDYWHDRYKVSAKQRDDLLKEVGDLKEWLQSKDEEIEHQIDYADLCSERVDKLIVTLVKIVEMTKDGKHDMRTYSFAVKALSAHAKAMRK